MTSHHGQNRRPPAKAGSQTTTLVRAGASKRRRFSGLRSGLRTASPPPSSPDWNLPRSGPRRALSVKDEETSRDRVSLALLDDTPLVESSEQITVGSSQIVSCSIALRGGWSSGTARPSASQKPAQATHSASPVSESRIHLPEVRQHEARREHTLVGRTLYWQTGCRAI